MLAYSLDLYTAHDSPIHHLAPGVKLILSVLSLVAIAATPDGAWPAYVVLAVLLAWATIVSGVPLGLVLGRGAAAAPFALAALTVLFTTPGQPLAAFDVLGADLLVTQAGLVRFVSILLKSWLSVQVAVLLTATTRFPELLRAMRGLGVPAVLVATARVAYRYLAVVGDEALRLLRARAARQATVDGGGPGVLWRARVTGGMAGSLFVRSIDRSQRVYQAMLARGYDGDVRLLPTAAANLRDGAIILLIAVLLMGIQILARVGWI